MIVSEDCGVNYEIIAVVFSSHYCISRGNSANTHDRWQIHNWFESYNDQFTSLTWAVCGWITPHSSWAISLAGVKRCSEGCASGRVKVGTAMTHYKRRFLSEMVFWPTYNNSNPLAIVYSFSLNVSCDRSSHWTYKNVTHRCSGHHREPPSLYSSSAQCCVSDNNVSPSLYNLSLPASPVSCLSLVLKPVSSYLDMIKAFMSNIRHLFLSPMLINMMNKTNYGQSTSPC